MCRSDASGSSQSERDGSGFSSESAERSSASEEESKSSGFGSDSEEDVNEDPNFLKLNENEFQELEFAQVETLIGVIKKTTKVNFEDISR